MKTYAHSTRRGKLYELICLHLILTFFGIYGVLARIGLRKLTKFDGALTVGNVLWSNFAGCLIMGFLVHDDALFHSLLLLIDEATGEKRYANKAAIPLYAGLATGACGTITSFSSFILDLFNYTMEQHNAGYGIMTFLAFLIITLTVSNGGFLVGKHLAIEAGYYRVKTNDRYCITKPVLRVIEYSLAVVGLLSYIAIIVLSICVPSSRYWMFSCLLAPWGVFARYHASLLWNRLSKTFMWGTFFCNVAGTTILALLSIANQSSAACTLLNAQGIAAGSDGFCGTFTTISTFVSELNSLRLRSSYFYAFVSIALSFALMVVIYGSYYWTGPHVSCIFANI